MQITTVIWDFDGTILDTEWPTFVSAKREFDRMGIELDLEEWQETIGTADHDPWWEVLRERAGGLGEPDDIVLGRYHKLKNELTDAATLMPGVKAGFDTVSATGHRSAVASSSSIEWVERHIRRHGLWHHLVAVATRTDVGVKRTKPAPDLFLLAAERAEVDPEACLVIEDSFHGVVGAKAAGMTVIAVPNRITTGQDFTAADLVVDSVESIDFHSFLVAA